MYFPAHFQHQEEGGFLVTFRDIPEAITQGDSLDEARLMARDALLTAMDFYFDDKRPVPQPSARRKGEELIRVPLSAAAKVYLLNEMIEQRVTPSDLARRLGTTPQEVNRLTDLHHTSKIDRVAQAVAALGKTMELSIK